MTDTNDDDAGGRPPRGRSPDRRASRDDRPARGGDRPSRPRDGERPPRRADGERPARDGDRPFRAKPAGDRPPRGPRPEGDRPFRARREEGERPRGKPPGDRPARASRPDGDRPARPRREEGERPFRPRPEGDRPFRSRPDGDRPVRARREDGDRPRTGERPARPRREDGDRPPRREGERPFRARRDEGDRAQSERPARRPAGDRPTRPEGDRPRRAPEAGRPAPRRRGYDEPPSAAPAVPVRERIAKIIARAGVASRRDAEKLIEEGRVTLAGEVVTSPALNVMSDAAIAIDGEPLPQRERTRLWLFHKPRGLVTTARDPEGRSTVFESLPPDLPRVVAVGRLDINTEGLLLLTNDGGLAKVLAHPTTGWLRRYKVRAFGDIDQAALDALIGGVTIDGIDYGPIEARIDRAQGDNLWMTMGIREGKNREIKVILEHLGLQVNRLIRVSFGPFQLGDIDMGQALEVPTRVLRDQLGDALAAEAGADFASPLREGADERPARGGEERPRRSREGEERPRRAASERPARARSEERPARGRFDDERPARGGKRPREEEPRPARAEPAARRTVWRAGEDEAEPRAFKPRRKGDPQSVRAAGAERPRERVGSIQAKGGKVLVERLVAAPRDEAAEKPARKPRRDAAPRGDAPPRRPRERTDGDAPPRRTRERAEGGERPTRSPRSEGPRDARPARDARPPRGDRPDRAPRGDRPDRPPRGDRPDRDSRPPRGGDRPQRDARPPREGGPPRRGPPAGGRGGPPKGRRPS